MRSSADARVRAVAAAVAATLWAACYGWPLVAVGGRSVDGVAGRDGLTLRTVTDVLADDRTWRLVGWSAAQTLASVAVCVAIGVPVGWVLGRLEFRGRRALSSVVMTPFVLPTLTVAGAMLALTGGLPRSTAARFALIVAAHACFNVGLVARAVAAAVASVPPSMEEAAASLGRGPVRAVRESTVAAVRPAVVGVALVVAMFCLTSFGVIVALGGATIATVEVEVWYAATRSLDLARAAVLAALQLLVVLAVMAWYQRVRPPRVSQVAHARRPVRTTADRVAVALGVAAVGLLCVAPLAALVVRSLRVGDRWGVDHYREVLTGSGAGRSAGATLASGAGPSAVGYTLAAAAVATVVALVIAAPVVVAAWRDDRMGRWIEQAMVVPLAVSAATLGLGFLLAFSGPAVDLRGAWVLVPLVQGAGAAPVVARLGIAAARSIDLAPADAASTLGARAWRRFVTVTWPALRRPTAVAAGFAFAMSVGEFGATVFLARGDRPTVPVLIGRLLGRPGTDSLGQALALSCLLGAIAVLSVVVVDRSPDGGATL